MSRVALLADAGESAGFGHLSRSSAIAVALGTRGIQSEAFAYGADRELERDGVVWHPVQGLEGVPDADVVVLDSYTLDAGAVEAARFVVLQEHTEAPPNAALVVNAGGEPGTASDRRLYGLGYACLRPGFWGLPTREVRDEVRHVLVATGSGDQESLGTSIASAIAADVDVVEGATRESLLDPLLAADVVVTAGGQTMLEAAATGAPVVALTLADNQRQQVERLAVAGGAIVADPAEPHAVAQAVERLAASPDDRRRLSRRAQAAVDGYGALRVAFRIDELLMPGR